ncbi:serine/threonine-protein kinase [Streptomyces prasinus]|uniref:serine/threonine-protein kinase n=1 Tax=Streptomyces prasinus TaxID=67345 RepID=UPI0036C669D9
MGTVYLSLTRGNQPVAFKVIRREYTQDQEFRRRFEAEARAARAVQGYHIAPVVDHDTAGSPPWLATTFIPGLPLDEALTAHGPLPVPTALHLVGCAAAALQAVHAAGVIHRDMKPSNILLGADGPWVIDFGIAKATDSTQLTRSGGFIGTPQYMSPEHAHGRPLTPATDVFSLGLIAAVAATGRHPYGDAGAITLATQIANTESRPPDLTGYPAPLRAVLERCLAADPGARPAPAELAALCEAGAGRPLRDFSGWLPPAVAADITARERQLSNLLREAATGAGQGCAAAPSVPGPVLSTAPARGGYVATHVSQAAHGPHHAPTQPAGPPASPAVPAAPPSGPVPAAGRGGVRMGVPARRRVRGRRAQRCDGFRRLPGERGLFLLEERRGREGGREGRRRVPGDLREEAVRHVLPLHRIHRPRPRRPQGDPLGQ